MTDAVPQPEPSDLEAAMRQHVTDHLQKRAHLARIDYFHSIFATHEESPLRPTVW